MQQFRLELNASKQLIINNLTHFLFNKKVIKWLIKICEILIKNKQILINYLKTNTRNFI